MYFEKTFFFKNLKLLVPLLVLPTLILKASLVNDQTNKYPLNLLKDSYNASRLVVKSIAKMLKKTGNSQNLLLKAYHIAIISSQDMDQAIKAYLDADKRAIDAMKKSQLIQKLSTAEEEEVSKGKMFTAQITAIKTVTIAANTTATTLIEIYAATSELKANLNELKQKFLVVSVKDEIKPKKSMKNEKSLQKNLIKMSIDKLGDETTGYMRYIYNFYKEMKSSGAEIQPVIVKPNFVDILALTAACELEYIIRPMINLAKDAKELAFRAAHVMCKRLTPKQTFNEEKKLDTIVEEEIWENDSQSSEESPLSGKKS